MSLAMRRAGRVAWLMVFGTLAGCGSPPPESPPAARPMPAPVTTGRMANAPAPDATTVAPIDVCARLTGDTVAAVIGDASATSFDAGPPYVGGCRWSARSGQRSVGVFVATAASLRLHGQPAVGDYVAGAGRQAMAQGTAVGGLGDAAYIDDFGATQVILVADGDRVLQVTATEFGRDAAERLARSALALPR